MPGFFQIRDAFQIFEFEKFESRINGQFWMVAVKVHVRRVRNFGTFFKTIKWKCLPKKKRRW